MQLIRLFRSHYHYGVSVLRLFPLFLSLVLTAANAVASPGVDCNKADPDVVIRGCTRAIETGNLSNRNLRLAYVHRAWAYNLKNKSDLALADCNRAIEIDPKISDAYVLRGQVNNNRQQYELAVADFDRAIEIDRNLAIAYAGWSVAYAQKGNVDGAITDISKGIQINPKNPLFLRIRARYYIKKGDLARSITDVDTAIQQDGKKADYYMLRAKIYELQARKEDAIKDLKKAISLGPSSQEAIAALNRLEIIGALQRSRAAP